MTVNISAVHFQADAKLKEFIMDKINKLSKFYDRILSVEVFLKLENSGQVRDKIVEIKTSLPGSILVSSSVEKSFEASVDEAQQQMISQIKRYKDKLNEAR